MMRKNIQKVACVSLFIFAFVILSSSKYFSKQLLSSNRHKNEQFLLNGNNTNENVTECKNRTIDEFPKDFLTDKQRNHGGVILHFLITFYLFGALAIVCDDYFVKSLEIISKDLKLKQDVAGATFMAAGSSAPELFTSIVGVLIAKSDVGLGTIVGSAVFNVLFILALCALAAKAPLKIDWYPLSRDCICYSISIIALIIVLIDGKVHWYEATILLILYLFYIMVMYFNNRIEKFIKIKIDKLSYYENEDEINETDIVDNDASAPLIRPNSLTKMGAIGNYTNPTEQENNVHDADDDDDDDKPINPFEVPCGILKKTYWLIFLPVSILFFFTVPDCRRKIFSRFPWYFLTFLISTFYLAVISYVLVWMVVIIAYTIDIPDTVAGLTVLAAGTSMPEVVTGIIVTRQGKGDMAISNSIGSNIFDILICLGLPWFISTVIVNTNSIVKIYSGGITYSAIILVSTVVGLIILTWLNKFVLSKKFGAFLFVFWLIVTLITCLFELDVFGKFSIPFCA